MTQLNAIVYFGLPCSGKSTHIQEQNYGFTTVCADDFKIKHKDYDPNHPERIHQESVELARQRINNLVESRERFVWDAGSINNNYTYDTLCFLKERGYQITLVVMDTPLEICLDRLSKRERKVPEDNIRMKATIFNKCLYRLISLGITLNRVPYYSHKNLFFDMDGVIAAWQRIVKNQHGEVDMVNGDFFKFANPVGPVLDKAWELKCRSYNLFILSAAGNSLCIQDKQAWLDSHAGMFERSKRYFVGNKRYKPDMYQELLVKLKINPRDATLIEDHHETIRICHERRLSAMHVSQFLAEKF